MAEEDEKEVIEEEEEECPKCPPVGAPAWMATFADMATLLMAFFRVDPLICRIQRAKIQTNFGFVEKRIWCAENRADC